jgi:ribosome-binding protein aMBF1 (putative translation factor)
MNAKRHAKGEAASGVKPARKESEDIVPSALVQSFGIGVRQLRAAQGWSQETLAENSNLNRSYIGEIERGCVIASLVTVEKLASALNLTPSALLMRGESISQMNIVRGIKLMAIAC